MKVHSRKWRLSSQTRLKKLEKFDEDNLPRAVLPGDIKDVLGVDGVLKPIRTTGYGNCLFNANSLALTGNESIQISLKLVLYIEI